MTLHYGALQCLIGPNGAGKTTLFNMIAGTFQPTSGRIQFEGTDIVGMPLHEYARFGITRKFQVPSVFQSMTVQENLELALQHRKTRGRVKERLDEMLDRIGLTDFADCRAGVLSHGQMQWLEIGMAVIPDPKLLLLDEPTAGMTGEQTRKVIDLLHELQGQMAIIVIEHDMHFIRALQSDTIVMHRGEILRQGSFADIEHDPLVRDVYLGRQ
jgi:ABC-type uncharacterized transport system ATPase subunit